MDYTTSADNVVHGPTGHRMHSDSVAVPTVWSGNDGNMIIWSLMELLKLANMDGQPFNPDDPDSYTLLRDALLAVFAKRSDYPRIYSITSLPTQNIGPITVAEAGEVWIWSASAYFTGYRSPLCGRPLDGHTLTPLASEVDAVGGTLSKTAYAALWGYAQENSLVVASGTWTAGMHKFVDLGGDNFRCPDLRNQFRRYTGTDADTANARTLGTRQTGQIQAHDHQYLTSNTNTSGLAKAAVRANTDGAADLRTESAGGSETRPINTAYAPRLHI
ncbi:phage tail protein [Pandoraea pnomenusa]|uniref:phage tail protein n=1 Tax=Pandoraea pnomenusa TaxID=93220 RepID=UPI00333F3EDF